MTEIEMDAYFRILAALRFLFPRMLAHERVAAAAVVAVSDAGLLRQGDTVVAP